MVWVPDLVPAINVPAVHHIPSPGASTAREKGFAGPAQERRDSGTLYEISPVDGAWASGRQAQLNIIWSRALMNKKVICACLVIFLISLPSCTSVNEKNELVDINERIASFFDNFEKNKSLAEKKEVELISYSTEGGSVTGYYNDNTIQHIEVEIYGELGRMEYLAYYISTSLKYYIITNIKYDKPMYEDDFEISEETTERYVLYGNKIYQYDKENLILVDSFKYNEVFTDFEKELD